MSVESQELTLDTVVTTDVGADSIGSSLTSGVGGGVGVDGGQKGEEKGGNGGGGKDDGDGNDKDGAGGEVAGVAVWDDGSAESSPVHSEEAVSPKMNSPSFLQRTCLSPSHSLRNQLYLSYGTISAVALLFVILAAIITTSLAGNQVKTMS